VMLITTGSVVSIKTPLIILLLPVLTYQNVQVEVVATKESLAFCDRADVESGCMWTNEAEWFGSYKIGDPIHYPSYQVQVEGWANIQILPFMLYRRFTSNSMIIFFIRSLCFVRWALAPATPTSTFPAMNTLMYVRTSAHVRIVQDVMLYQIVGPIGKTRMWGRQYVTSTFCFRCR
ncbi:hypothetical protein BDR05DRAFT_894086, partial [Suillus weaverae]